MDDTWVMDTAKHAKILEWGPRVCVAGIAVLCCGWLVGDWLYWIDLISAFVVQSVVIAGTLGVVLLIAKRWKLSLVCLVCVAIGLVPVLSNRRVSLIDAKIGDQVVSVGTLNMYPRNTSWEIDFATMLELDLDVLVIQELPIGLSRAVRGIAVDGEEPSPGLLEGTAMPHWVHRAWVDQEVSPGFVISRWPLELIDPEGSSELDNDLGHHQLWCIVHHPEGRFIAGLMHPWSPRKATRWREGNAVVRAHRKEAERLLDVYGLPMIVGADMNSARAQYRSREMRKSGINPSKPLLSFEGGSFPSGMPGVVQIQLDDLWVSDDVGVSSWGMLDVTGSDHRAVVGGFVLPDHAATE